MNRMRWHLPPWIKRAYMFVVGLTLIYVLWQSGPSLSRWLELARTPAVYGFIGGWIAMAAMLGGLWALVLRWCFGVQLTVKEWMPIQALAWGGRYLPGKLGMLAGKLSVLGKDGIDWRVLGHSVLFEQLAFVCAGAALGLLLVQPGGAFGQWMPGWMEHHWSIARILGALGCVMAFLIAVWISERALLSRLAVSTLAQTRKIALLAAYVVPHLLVGAGFYALAVHLLPGSARLGMGQMIAILALANVAGILAVFAPAGLGVRDLVLAMALAGTATLAEALALAALLRLLTVLADGLFLSVGLLVGRVRVSGE